MRPELLLYLVVVVAVVLYARASAPRLAGTLAPLASLEDLNAPILLPRRRFSIPDLPPLPPVVDE